jgi:hypothetical protein
METGQVKFWLDGAAVFHTDIAPRTIEHGVVIDNQYAALPPSGGI